MHRQTARPISQPQVIPRRGSSADTPDAQAGRRISRTRLHDRPLLHNRLPAVMVHISRYAFEGQARLAADVGVSRSTISRFLRGHTSPSYSLVEAVTRALSARLGKALGPARTGRL